MIVIIVYKTKELTSKQRRPTLTLTPHALKQDHVWKDWKDVTIFWYCKCAAENAYVKKKDAPESVHGRGRAYGFV